MSAKRKSAFSVYRSRKQAEKKGNSTSVLQYADQDSCTSSEADKPVAMPHSKSKKLNKKDPLNLKENVNGEIVEKQSATKPFSRASRLRHSIGNIGMNRKKRKIKARPEAEHGSSDSEDDVKRVKMIVPSTTSESDVNSPNVATTSMQSGYDEYVTDKEMESLPRKTFEWLISPVKTGKFFRYNI